MKSVTGRAVITSIVPSNHLSQWEVSLLYNSWVSFRQLRHYPLVPCSWCYPVASCMIFPHCKSNGFFRYKIVIVYYKLHLVILIISWIGFWPSIFSSDSSHFLSDSACVQWPADGHCWYMRLSTNATFCHHVSCISIVHDIFLCQSIHGHLHHLYWSGCLSCHSNENFLCPELSRFQFSMTTLFITAYI